MRGERGVACLKTGADLGMGESPFLSGGRLQETQFARLLPVKGDEIETGAENSTERGLRM